jgi:Carboxypeptidase regulatory-like domain/TonB dependent receptor
MRRVLLAVAIVLTLVVAGNAQTFRGAINGTVTDPSGAAVPGAQVKATESSTGIDHTTVSTSDGVFAFQDIPLGFYKITVTASGFPPFTVDRVEVLAGTIYTLPVKLSLQQQTTTVEVSAAAITLDTTTQTQNMTIASDVVQDVPLNGRDFTQLVAIAPGYGGYSVGGFGSLNGTRANQMNWQIDGVDNNDFWHNIPAVNQGGVSGIAGIVLPIDSIDEFSAQTQSGAEAGRNAGGTVNLVIKSGGNDLHGSLYYYNRNEFYGAHSPFFVRSATVPKAPPLRNQNYGFSVGGPIFKNKTFFFVSYEKQEYIIGLSGLATEPSAAWVSQAGSVLANAGVPVSLVSCNLLGNLVKLLPASQIPAGCKSTTRGLWPTSGPGSILDLPGTPKNFFSPIASTGYSYNGVIKLDHNFNDKHHIYARAFLGQGSQTAPLGGSPALGTASSNLKDYFEVAPIHVYNYSVVLNSTFSTRLTNQVLTGVNYFNQVFHDFNNSFDTKNTFGLFLSPDATDLGKPILGAPNIVISPPSGSSGAGFEQVGLTPPEGRNDVTWHITDIVSYTTGNHQLRFGGEARQGRVNEFYHRRGTGKFIFDGLSPLSPWRTSTSIDDTTKALADFLAGNVAGPDPVLDPGITGSTIAVGNPERSVRVNAFDLFAGDSWKLSSRLTVNLGLRYEYFGPLHSGNKDLANFIPGQGLLVQGAGLDSLYHPDRNNFAPRIGFAYTANSKGDLVVRGGVGVFYDQVNMNPFLDFRPPIAAAQGIQGNPIGAAPVSTYSRSTYNWDAAQNGGASIFPGVVSWTDPNCGNVSGLALFSVNRNFRTPYFYNYNLQVEKGLGTFAVLQVGYVGSEGRKLNIVTDINQNKAFPNFGHIIQLNSIGTSNYNSLQATFRIRSWHGLTSQLGYTWSHSLDEISQYRAAILDDAFNRQRDYGNSDFDTRHLFTASFTYEVPKASWASSGWANRLVNGWQLSSLWNFHTGQPSDELLSGLNLIGNPYAGVSHNFSAAAGGTQWWNPAAFAPATSGAVCPNTSTGFCGDISRNKFYAPGFADVDFSVIKNIPVTERVKVQLRAEMFNLTNRINLASGPGSVGSSCAAVAGVCSTKSGFGLVSDTIGDFNGAPGIGPGEAFNLQLVAKIIF